MQILLMNLRCCWEVTLCTFMWEFLYGGYLRKCYCDVMKHPFVLYHALCGVLPVGAVMCLIGPLVSGRSYYCAKRHTLYVEPMLISQTFISDSWSTEKTYNKFHIQIHCKQTYILYKSTIRRHGLKRIRISRCPTKKQLYQCLHNWNW